MKQGILCNHRVRLLFKKGMSCFRERRKGCRKRASNIRKLFSLEKKDDVRQFVVRRDTGKRKKAPKIQRLVTSRTLQRKRYKRAQIRNRMVNSHKMEADYKKRCIEYKQEQKEARAAEVAKKKKKA